MGAQVQEEGSEQAQLQLQERLAQAEAEAAEAAQQLRFQVQATESLQGSLDTLAAERNALREAQAAGSGEHAAASEASRERLQAAQQQVALLQAETARLSAQCQALEDRQAATATEHLTTVDRLVRIVALAAPDSPACRHMWSLL